MKIRPAGIDEIQYLSDLCLRSKAHWGYDTAFIEACRVPLTLRAKDVETSLVMVAEVDGSIAGLVQLRVEGEDGELEKLFIEPGFIGQGIGDALLRYALDAARQAGAQRIGLDADPFAEPFYRKYDARKVGDSMSEVDPDRLLSRLVIDC